MLSSFPSLFSRCSSLLQVLSRSILGSVVLLLQHQQADVSVFAEGITIFVISGSYFWKSLKKEMELFFEKVVFSILGNISMHRKVDRFLMERLLLQSLIDLLQSPFAIDQLFLNYDCDEYALNITSILFAIVPIFFPFYSRSMKKSNSIVPILQLFKILICSVVSSLSFCSIFLCKRRIILIEVRICDCVVFKSPELLLVLMQATRLASPLFLIVVITILFFSLGIFSDPPKANEVARFLRSATLLDKRKIGEYLGNADSFHRDVLESYVASFDFRGNGLLVGLRMFLESFRLPGESQQIDRIMEV